MLKSSNKIETNKYELEVTVDAAGLEAAIQKVFKRRAKAINVPGFRKGKAPRKIIEKLYGEGFFYEDAVNALVPVAVDEAVKEAGLKPVVRPDVEVTSLGKDTGVIFKVTVVNKPEVEIADYKGIEVTKETKEVTDEDVDAEIKRVQERQGRMVSVEDRAVENGDLTVIDFEGFIDGVAFDGGKEDGYELKIGAGYFIPGFEEQIIGHKIGEEFTINVTFPENYQMEDVAGKPAEFKIKLHEIKALELPEVDDEFVKDVSEFDTVDEYKADIKQKLTERAEKNAEAAVKNKIYDTVIEKLQAEIPTEMIDNQINQMAAEFEQRISMQGLNLEMYLSYTGLTEESFRAQFTDNATTQVKLRLAFEKIAELEGCEVSDEDVTAEIEKIAQTYNLKVKDVLGIISPAVVRQDLLVEKAAKIVEDSAKIS